MCVYVSYTHSYYRKNQPTRKLHAYINHYTITLSKNEADPLNSKLSVEAKEVAMCLCLSVCVCSFSNLLQHIPRLVIFSNIFEDFVNFNTNKDYS